MLGYQNKHSVGVLENQHISLLIDRKTDVSRIKSTHFSHISYSDNHHNEIAHSRPSQFLPHNTNMLLNSYIVVAASVLVAIIAAAPVSTPLDSRTLSLKGPVIFLSNCFNTNGASYGEFD